MRQKEHSENPLKYVGFMDVLGYKSIVLRNDWTDGKKRQILRSLYENLIVAAQNATMPESEYYGHVPYVHFSDSFYFSSESSNAICFTMAKFISNFLSYYQQTYGDDTWVPFVRGAVVKDWIIETYDPSAPASDDANLRFRNPVGPGVARAYLLSEETGINGMRIVCTREVAEDYRAELPNRAEFLQSVMAPLLPVPYDKEDLFEVPWYGLMLLSDNTNGPLDLLKRSRRQFSSESVKHFDGTIEAILKTPNLENYPQLIDNLNQMQHRSL